MIHLVVILLLVFTACTHQTEGEKESQITSIQFVDRHGFSETVSAKERLSQYQNVDFLTPQPYQKVTRVFGRDRLGKTHSTITSYHSNGQVSHYLDIADGRAHGYYREWHENGQLKLEAQVIEGVADFSPIAQSSWLFEGKSQAWDDEGHCLAEIFYAKGALEGVAKYYYPDGKIRKEIPYTHDEIDGIELHYGADGSILEKICYEKGLREGSAEGFWNKEALKYKEEYKKDRLMSGIYFANNGETISEVNAGEGMQAIFDERGLRSMVEHHNGVVDGLIQLFGEKGQLLREYAFKEGKKNGEEIEYYPINKEGKLLPKLLVTWHEDQLHGPVKTWYENGLVESQKEMASNKKHGMSFAWYKDGAVMLSEEYENDRLVRGTYFKKGEKSPTSKIEAGKGVATLFDASGRYLKKITYDKGKPTLDKE